MSTIPKSEGGFTAIELVVMLVVLATAFASFAGAFGSIQTITKKAKDLNNANQVAFAKVQEYENKTFSGIPTTSPADTLQQVEDFSSSLPTSLQAPRTGIVYVNTSASGTLKQVVVSIHYGSGSNARYIDYADFIQKNGL